MWPTLGSRTAEEQNRTELTYLQNRLPYIYYHTKYEEKGRPKKKDGLMTFVITVWASDIQHRKLLV